MPNLLGASAEEHYAWRLRQHCPRCAGAVKDCPECHGISAPPRPEVVHALADACRDCGTVKVRRQWDDCSSVLRHAAEEIDAYLKEEERS